MIHAYKDYIYTKLLTKFSLNVGGWGVQQEKEYKEVFEVFQEKNNEKAQLTATLVEVVKNPFDFYPYLHH